MPHTCLPLIIKLFLFSLLNSQQLVQGAAASSPLCCPLSKQPETLTRVSSENTCGEHKDESERSGKVWLVGLVCFFFFTSSAWTCIIIWCKYLFLAPGWQSGKCKVALCTVLYRNSVGFAEGRYAQEWQSWAPLWVGANITSPVSGLFLHNVLKKLTLGNSEKTAMCCCALTAWARVEWPHRGLNELCRCLREKCWPPGVCGSLGNLAGRPRKSF